MKVIEITPYMGIHRASLDNGMYIIFRHEVDTYDLHNAEGHYLHVLDNPSNRSPQQWWDYLKRLVVEFENKQS